MSPRVEIVITDFMSGNAHSQHERMSSMSTLVMSFVRSFWVRVIKWRTNVRALRSTGNRITAACLAVTFYLLRPGTKAD
jgi:hypothetical protein